MNLTDTTRLDPTEVRHLHGLASFCLPYSYPPRCPFCESTRAGCISSHFGTRSTTRFGYITVPQTSFSTTPPPTTMIIWFEFNTAYARGFNLGQLTTELTELWRDRIG